MKTIDVNKIYCFVADNIFNRVCLYVQIFTSIQNSNFKYLNDFRWRHQLYRSCSCKQDLKHCS